MNKKDIAYLLEKFRSGQSTSEEERALKGWLHHYNMDSATGLTEKDFTIARKKMLHGINAARYPEVNKFRLWRRLALAAAVAVIVFGIGLFYYPGNKADRATLTHLNDIPPGKNIATLTLANGKIIKLDTNRSSVVVADSVNATTMVTAATPHGGTYQFVLPDGTRVWLNAESTISFPSTFTGKERKTVLSGEAYFEVAKVTGAPGKAVPEGNAFIVESRGQSVRVLGTHFNINTYRNEKSIKTTLLEGSVQVASAASKQHVILQPNEQAIIINNGNINVRKVNGEDAIGWQKGMFIFEHEDIRSVMRKLSRWYNINVIYQPGTGNARIGGVISRYEQVSKVLEMINATKTVHCVLEGNTVTVKQFEANL